MKTFILILSFVCLIHTNAFPLNNNSVPISIDGNTLNDLLSQPVNSSGYMLASGFILGFDTGYNFRGRINPGSDDVVCYPRGVTEGQVVSVVKKYLENNPKDLHKNSGFLIAMALHSAWPCK